MLKKIPRRLTRHDPYKSDSSFQPARDYIVKFLPQIKRVRGGVRIRAKKVIQILNKAGKSSDILIPAIGPAKSKIVARHVRKYKPKTVYDIGTLFGYSAIILAMNMPKDGKLTTIQKSTKNMKIAKVIIKAAGLSDKVRMVVGDATKVIPHFDNNIDMVLMDGYKSEYFEYLKRIEPEIGIGSILIADNVLVFKNDMKNFLKEVRNPKGKYKSKTANTFRAFSKSKDALEISEKIR